MCGLPPTAHPGYLKQFAPCNRVFIPSRIPGLTRSVTVVPPSSRVIERTHASVAVEVEGLTDLTGARGAAASRARVARIATSGGGARRVGDGELLAEGLTAHGAPALRGLGLDPAGDAVHMEGMRALADD
jgi:hypothetical protein